MSNAARAPQALQGFVFFFGGLAFSLFIIFLTGLPDSQIIFPYTVIVPLFLCVFLHAGMYFMRLAFTQRADWGTQASVSEKLSLFWSVIFQITFLIGMMTVGYLFWFFVLQRMPGWAWNGHVTVEIVTYMLYGTILGRIALAFFRRFGKGFRIATASATPFYTLEEGGITFHFGFIRLGNQPERAAHIRFDELDLLKVMTYREAEQFMRYQSGIGLADKFNAGISAPAEMFRFLNGKTDRPKYFSQLQTGLPILLMHGPNLFYSVAISNTDNTALFEAFERSRAGKA